MQKIAPTSPVQTSPANVSKPGRSTAPDADRPRSSSMTVTFVNPSARAWSARAYWSRVLSLLFST